MTVTEFVQVNELMADRMSYILDLKHEAKHYENEISAQTAMLRKDIEDAGETDFTCDAGTARIIAVSGSVDYGQAIHAIWLLIKSRCDWWGVHGFAADDIIDEMRTLESDFQIGSFRKPATSRFEVKARLKPLAEVWREDMQPDRAAIRRAAAQRAMPGSKVATDQEGRACR